MDPLVLFIEFLDSAQHFLTLLYLLGLLHLGEGLELYLQFGLELGHIRLEVRPGPECFFDIF